MKLCHSMTRWTGGARWGYKLLQTSIILQDYRHTLKFVSIMGFHFDTADWSERW